MHELGLLGATKPVQKADTSIDQITTEEEATDLRYIFEGVGFYKPEGYYHQCLAEQQEGKRLLLGARLDDYLVGYCMLNWKPKYHFFRKFGIPEIQDLNVIPVARRKGVATSLITYCENLARSRGHDQMGIGVGLLSDYGPAQRLYVRLGYMPDGCGVTYDRQTLTHGELRPFDDELCLMMVKDL